MLTFHSEDNIDKDFILNRVSQEEIFEKYLIPVTYEGRVCSPLRNDKTPTCGFRRNSDGVIRFKDFSGHFHGDCFNAVEHIYGVGFYEALSIIAGDFGLKSKVDRVPRDPMVYEPKSYCEIRVKWSKWKSNDIMYWHNQRISIRTLNYYNVGVVSHAWINEKQVYSMREGDPCYGYWFDGQFKLYYPSRTNVRFLNNFTGLQGYSQLPDKGETLVVTKSLKDVMFLYELGIPAVATSSESVALTDEQFLDLNERFDKIVTLFDFDLTGVRTANLMRKLYGIPAIFLTNGRFGTVNYKGKDPTDAYKNGLDPSVIINLIEGV